MIKKVIKIAYRKLLNHASHDKKANYLRKRGVKVGTGNRFNCDLSFVGSEPYLVEIGSDCVFAGEVKFFTHDGGVNVINKLYYRDEYKDKVGKVKIGDNCFIGFRTIVLPNVTIGNNCIVGAGSIVSKDLPDNGVYAGVPAKFICSIEDYNNKCKDTLIKGVPASQRKEYITQIFENKL